MNGRLKRWLSLFIIILFTAGCSTFSLHLTFNDIDGLKKGNALFFDQNQVGKVTDIVYTEAGDYRVTVTVDDAFKAAFTEHSRFDIISSPLQENEKAILMGLARKGGKPLEKGATIKAVPTSPLQGLTPLLDRFKTGIDDFMEQMKSLPENEKYQQFEKKLDALAKQMKASGKAFQEQMKNDIIPRLKKELNDLSDHLTPKEKKEKTLPLEEKLNALEDV